MLCCAYQEMVRDAFLREVALKRELLLLELGGMALDPSSRGDVCTFAFDGVRHLLMDVTVRTPSLQWEDTESFLEPAELDEEKRYYHQVVFFFRCGLGAWWVSWNQAFNN